MSASARTLLSRITTVSAAGTCLLAAACSGTSSAAGHPAQDSPRPTRHIVSYQVDGHGTADITWSGTSGGTATGVTLPWHRTGQRSDGTRGVTLTVVLGRTGGKATCSLTVDGRRVGTSLAQGSYGRAACTTQATATARGNAASDA
ncbi:hypothetical protein [Actinacidiphila rubida]|uniref:Ig-like domain-containing protein n=1 Tax=Actinacidiphila rubida TaxID=310780 RepID=A0A1H8SKK3_9ACTN|nr:hypothetical protein [Actinacidiphila rubida]SEO79087.1 hypothetical protein SAMN05216267_104330 [Actinacidiphila rubida]